MHRKLKIFAAALAAALTTTIVPFTILNAATAPSSNQTIIVVADVSGSVLQNDPMSYWKDTVGLAIDLAPNGSQVGVVTVAEDVSTDTGLLDTADYANRQVLKDSLPEVTPYGYTNLAAGIETAVANATAGNGDKHILLIADINEGGFALPWGTDLEEEYSRIEKTAKQAAAQSIHIHILFYADPSGNEDLMARWEQLARQTDGSIVYADSPAQLPSEVEALYFSLFDYTTIQATSINTTGTEQQIQVQVPTTAVSRARIYISASSPVDGIQAKSASGLDYSHNQSYSMIEVLEPAEETISLALQHGEAERVNIYLILDVQPSLTASVQSFEEQVIPDDETEPITFVQRSLFEFTVEELSGNVLIPGSAGEVEWVLTLTSPDGETRTMPRAEYVDGMFSQVIYPEQFGTYTIELVIQEQGTELVRIADTFDVEAIELQEPIYPEEPDYSIPIAISIGGVIILAALGFLLYKRHQKRKQEPKVMRAEPLPSVPGEVEPQFTGKLAIYGIKVDGGKTEVPAVSVKLRRFGKQKKVTLAQAMKMAGSVYHYVDAEQLWLLPAADNTLIISNQSDAYMLIMGRKITKGQQVKLAYGQKVYLVFEEDVNEYEVYFQQAIESPSPDDMSGFTMDLAN